MAEITESEWSDKYKPMTNHLTNDGISYETYGDELEYILLQDDRHVWTEMDGDDGVYIVNGYHLVNRISYYLTNVPWQDGEHIEICICKFVVCDCYDPEDEETEPSTDCEQCWGEGTYTDWSMN